MMGTLSYTGVGGGASLQYHVESGYEGTVCELERPDTRDRAYTHHDGMPPVWLLAHVGVDIPQDRLPGLDIPLLLRGLGDGEAHAPACVEDDPAGPEAHAHEDDE